MINEFMHKKPTKRHLKVLRIVGISIVGVLFAVIFAFVFGYFVKILWNWLIPTLFGLKEITFWQAFGLIILVKLLFGNFSPPHHRSDHIHRMANRKWHHAMGFKDENTDYPENKWKQFWKDEGKTAFEDYLKRMKNQTDEQKEE